MTTIIISPPLLFIVASLLFLSGGCDHNVGAFNINSAPAASTTLTTRRHTSPTRLLLSGEVVYSETTSSSSSSSSSSKSSTNIRKIIPTKEMFVKPPRVVPEDPTLIPILYNYDHCPFCVRVRLALGFKNIKHNLVFLANDDVATPTAMVGKKVSPIMKIPAAKTTTNGDDTEEDENNENDSDNDEEDENNENDYDDEEDDEEDLYMIESMDIIEYLENDDRFGPTNILRPASGRTDLKEWQKSVRMQMRTLQRPRYVATGLIPEFQQLDSRHAFIANHPLPPYDKDEWKSMKDLSEKLTIYADAMANDPTCMIEELNAKLVALDDIVYCDTYCTEGGLSMDDIDLWARLRSISIVQDVEWPDGLRRYMDNLSELGDVPLYDGLAI